MRVVGKRKEGQAKPPAPGDLQALLKSDEAEYWRQVERIAEQMATLARERAARLGPLAFNEKPRRGTG